MKVLIIDTSTDNLFVRFYDEDKNIDFYEKEMISHNNHSEHLLKVIEEGLKQNNMALKDFDKIVTGIGPGSYTGLRICLVVAKMASYTLNIPLYTISSLSLVSSSVTQKGVYAVKIKAKKDHSYYQIFKIDNEKEILLDDYYSHDDVFVQNVNKYNAQIIDSYKLNSLNILKEAKLVNQIHDLTPNYLRKANS